MGDQRVGWVGGRVLSRSGEQQQSRVLSEVGPEGSVPTARFVKEVLQRTEREKEYPRAALVTEISQSSSCHVNIPEQLLSRKLTLLSETDKRGPCLRFFVLRSLERERAEQGVAAERDLRAESLKQGGGGVGLEGWWRKWELRSDKDGLECQSQQADPTASNREKTFATRSPPPRRPAAGYPLVDPHSLMTHPPHSSDSDSCRMWAWGSSHLTRCPTTNFIEPTDDVVSKETPAHSHFIPRRPTTSPPHARPIPWRICFSLSSRPFWGGGLDGDDEIGKDGHGG